MPHAYTQIWVHIVFSTSSRKELIREHFKDKLYKYIEDIITSDFKSEVIAINGTENHIHILLKQNPLFALSNIIKHIKGGSSHWINQNKFIRETFIWQNGYGAFSVSSQAVKKVVAYIENQKAHHSEMTFDDEVKRLVSYSKSRN